MNKLFTKAGYRMLRKSAAIMGLIASSLFSTHADNNPIIFQPSNPINFTVTATGNPSPVAQTLEDMKATLINDKAIQNSEKPFYYRLANGLKDCIENKGMDELNKVANEMIKKYDKTANSSWMHINRDIAYAQEVAYKIISGASEGRFLVNLVVGDIKNSNAKKAKEVLNNIFIAQNKALNNLIQKGLSLYASPSEIQNNQTLLSKIIKSGINIEGININEAISNAPANIDILESIGNALLNSNVLSSKVLKSNRIENSCLTTEDIKTGINSLIERLNRADIKNSPNAKSFSNILLALNYATSLDVFTQKATTFMGYKKIRSKKTGLFTYTKVRNQKEGEKVNFAEYQQLAIQQFSLLIEASKIASNDLNTDIAGRFVDKIAQSRKNFIELLRLAKQYQSKNILTSIINAQEQFLLKVLNNKKIDIYATNEDNPSILSTIIAADIEIPGFNIQEAVENCPNTLECVGSLIEGLVKTEARNVNDARSQMAYKLSEKLSKIDTKDKDFSKLIKQSSEKKHIMQKIYDEDALKKNTMQRSLNLYLQKVELKSKQERQDEKIKKQLTQEKAKQKQEQLMQKQEELRLEQVRQRKEEQEKREKEERIKEEQLRQERQKEEQLNRMKLSNNSAANDLVKNYVHLTDNLETLFDVGVRELAKYQGKVEKLPAQGYVAKLGAFTERQISLLKEISQNANNLNTELAAKIVDRIKESKASLDKLSKNAVKISYGPIASNQLIRSEKSLGDSIIKAQNEALASILKGQNIDIYRTNGNNPSILAKILASDIEIPGFDIKKAVKNCPETLECLSSLIEGLVKNDEPVISLDLRIKIAEKLSKKLSNVEYTTNKSLLMKKNTIGEKLDTYKAKVSKLKSQEEQSKANLQAPTAEKKELSKAERAEVIKALKVEKENLIKKRQIKYSHEGEKRLKEVKNLLAENLKKLVDQMNGVFVDEDDGNEYGYNEYSYNKNYELINKRQHLVNEDGYLINKDGHLVDWNDRLVDGEGYYVDENDNYVDEQGNPSDKKILSNNMDEDQ